MLDYQKLIRFFDEYIAHYHEMLQFETEKLRLIAADDIEALNNAMGREQAFIMKTNAMEHRRLELLSGSAGKTFQEIIQEAPQEFRASLESRHNNLSRVVFQIKSLNSNAQEIVSRRLEMLETISSGKATDTYTKEGVKSRSSQGPKTLNKDI